MFGRKRHVPTARDAEEVVSLRTLDSARSITPREYEHPYAGAFEQVVMERLIRMIRAGATDVETIAVLEAEITAQETLEHADLDRQRAYHVRVCAEIVTVARRNLTDAQNDLKRAGVSLARALEQLDRVEARYAASDPDHRQLI
jgi:hypothetical protein